MVNMFGMDLIIPIALATSITVFLSLSWLKKRRGPPQPPGPIGLPLVGHLPFLRTDLHRCFADLSRIHGPVMSIRLGFKRSVVLSSPSAAREAIRDNAAIFSSHDVPATADAIMRSTGIGMLWAPYGPVWRTLRKVSVRDLLGQSSLQASRPQRRSVVRHMVAQVHAKACSPIEIQHTVFLATLNMMTSMLWGGTVDDECVKDEFVEVVNGIVDLLGKPNVSDFYPILAPLDIQGRVREMVRLTDWYYRILDSIIEDRRRKISTSVSGEGAVYKGKDFLQVMLDLLDRGEDNEVPLKIDHVKALFVDMIAGGTDTTSNTTEWAMAELLQNSDVMRKVHDELDAVVGKNRVVEESDLPRLSYLEAVVKEVFRLHPVVPLLVPYSASTSCTVGGFYVPKDAKVFVNVWAIHRDESVWEDPLKFKPERFLDRKYDFSGNNFDYLPFGSGRRICPGILLGEKMVVYMLASLLHSFDWRLMGGTVVEFSDKFEIVLRKAKPLVVIPSPRLSKPECYT